MLVVTLCDAKFENLAPYSIKYICRFYHDSALWLRNS